MKLYDAKFIKEFIEKNKDEIDCVSCGMKEDWFLTGETVFEKGKFLFEFENKEIKLAGIKGSFWATPVMEVLYKNGETHIIPCYFEDEKTVDDYAIFNMKEFAKMTGGMDDVTDTI